MNIVESDAGVYNIKYLTYMLERTLGPDFLMKAVEDKRIQGTVADLIRMRDLQEEIAPSKPAQRETRWIDS